VIKEFDGGSFEYRLPRLKEGLRLKSEMRRYAVKMGVDDYNTWDTLLIIIEKSGFLVDVIKHETAKTYDELTDLKEAENAILEFASEVIEEMYPDEKE
jgi:hypothetical protein